MKINPTKDKKMVIATDSQKNKVLPISFDEKDDNRPFSLGMTVNFKIGKNSLLFYFIDTCLEQIIESPVNQIIHRTCYYFFDRFVSNEHQAAVNDLFPKAISLMEQHWKENFTVNLLFNIHSKIQSLKNKRILLQLQKGNQQSLEDEPLLDGKIFEITELCSDGIPKLLLINKNHIVQILTYKEYSNFKSSVFGLNNRELNILELKCRGKRTKEISQTLRISEMSIYSTIRDIKEKTKLDVIPLIQILSEKGIISCHT